MKRFFLELVALAACSGALLGACSSSSDASQAGAAGSAAGGAASESAGVGGSAGGASGGAGHSGVAGAAGDAGDAGSTGVAGTGGAAGGATAGAGGASGALGCDLMLLLDVSSSMASSSKWTNVESAVTSFVEGAPSMNIALQFFPLMRSAGAACAATDYATPLVPFGSASQVAASVSNRLQSIALAGSTPTATALTGVIGYTSSYVSSHPGDTGAVVVVTDGDPAACTGESWTSADSAATNGRAGTPSVKTWVVGIGPALTDLDALATAGGTQAVSLAGAAVTPDNLLLALQQVVNATCP